MAKKKEFKLPMFISWDSKDPVHSAMRYRKNHDDYYRDGGNWSTGYKIVDGEVISVFDEHSNDSLNGRKLVKITKAAWRKDNGRYAPSNEDLKEDSKGRDEMPFTW